MIEKQQKNNITSDQPLADGRAGLATENGAPIVDVVPNSQKIGEKPEMSKGEKAFDWTVYHGLNYWTNLIMSVAISDYLTYEKSSGRKFLDKGIEKTTLLLQKAGMSLKNAHHKADLGITFLSLLSGGYALLVPLKTLEDNKRNIVHSLNEKMGVDQTAPDGHKLSPDEIHIEKEQPKQSWFNVIWRRVFGTAAVVGTGMAVDNLLKDKNNILPPLPSKEITIAGQKITYDSRPMGGKQRAEEFIVRNVNKGLKYIPVIGEKMINNPRSQRWIALAALDSFFTVITAVVMKATNGAKKAKMPHELDNSCDIPSHDKIPDQIVPDEGYDNKKTNHSAKFAPRDKEKKAVDKKSISPEEFLGASSGNSAQIGFA